MFRRMFILLFACLATAITGELCVASAQRIQERAYTVNHRCDTDDQLRITKVTLARSETRVQVTFKCNNPDGCAPCTAPPGHKEAFFLKDAKTGKKYDLLNVKGIAILPKRSNMAYGESLFFTLSFAKVADSLNSFHLIEGEVEPAPDPQTGFIPVMWRFMNVRFR